ncbi:MAG TPA: transcriptional regulator [Bacteroidales bacterium]|jgi:predicted transcriptional regulator|nr:transcriptional regulator [Bacteroidales bacterium]
MSLKSKYNPTESELEILQLLWEYGPSTVRFINEKQNEEKSLSAKQAGKAGVGYTTTLKIMQIMAEKGMLDVNKNSRQHIYTPSLDEDETKSKLLDGFLKKTFSGSAMKMVMQALGNHNPSKEELDEIKNLIHEIENNPKKS